jgi:hypothetical protein
MGYGGLTAFCEFKNLDNPEDLAKRKTHEWRKLSHDDMELELVDLFTRIKELLDERAAKDARISELTEALKPFGDISCPATERDFSDDEPIVVKFGSDVNYTVSTYRTFGDLRRARFALCQAPSSDEAPHQRAEGAFQSGAEWKPRIKELLDGQDATS